jgi:hypothetical protein
MVFVSHIYVSLQEGKSQYPLVNVYIAIENGHLEWNYPLKMVIFHSHVSLPEGISNCFWGKSHLFFAARWRCQDDILRLLATSEGDVLEDDTLVDKVWNGWR